MSKIPLAEFHYYARLQREFEESRIDESHQVTGDNSSGSSSNEKGESNQVQLRSADNDDLQYQSLTSDQKDKLNARRALRMATASAVFFLITTDILGPNGAPYAMVSVEIDCFELERIPERETDIMAMLASLSYFLFFQSHKSVTYQETSCTSFSVVLLVTLV